jgi:DNA-binding NarL/FixJ family response regulator
MVITQAGSAKTFDCYLRGYAFVGACANCNEVEDDMFTMRQDVVLTDVDMPDVNDIEGLKRIRSALPIFS